MFPHSIKVLLLGGPGDGERYMVEGWRPVIVYAKTEEEPSYTSCSDPVPIQMQEVAYHIQSIRGSTQDYYVAAPDYWSGDEILEKLLAGYRNLN